MALEKIDKIKKITQELNPEQPTHAPNKDYFESLMNQRRTTVEETGQSQKEIAKQTENSLFDEVRALNTRVDNTARFSPSEIASQADSVIAQIDTLKTKLETPGLEIKGSVQSILRNKLSHIDENLKMTLDRVGIEYKPPERATSMSGPIDRFLGMLTNAQNQLQTIGEDVRTLASDTSSFTPATLLLVQMKVSFIQQEMELFTSMLNKSLESTKTIMNVQV